MKKTYLKVCLILIFGIGFLSTSWGQNMTSMMRALEKENFKGLYRKADKLTQNDSLHVGAFFMKCLYFSHLNNEFFNPDSAYFYLQKTKTSYPYISPHLEKELQNLGINLEKIQSQKSAIERAKFDYREAIAQQKKHQKELLQTLSASRRLSSQDLYAERYAVAQRLNTYEAYKRFLDKYPKAPQYEEAIKNYQRLFYQDKTQNNTAESYEKFIRDYPKNAYKQEAQDKLLKTLLTDHSRTVYEKILSKSDILPKEYTQKILGLWWFLEKDKLYFMKKCPIIYKPIFEKYFQYCYLNTFPVWQDEKIHILDSVGTILQTFRHKKYICEPRIPSLVLSQEDYLLGAFDYTGRSILPYKFHQIDILGNELLQVKRGNKFGVYHRFGFELVETIYSEIDLLSDIYIRVRTGDKYGLYLINGQELLPPKFDAIEVMTGDTLRIDAESQTAILDRKKLIQYQNISNKTPLFRWQMPKITHQRYLQVPEGGLLGIYQASGKKLVSLQGNKITETPQGWAIHIYNKLYFFDTLGNYQFTTIAENLLPHPEFVALKSGTKWTVCYYNGKPLVEPEYESAQHLGKAGFLLKKGEEYHFLHESGQFKFLGKYKNVAVRYTDTQSSLWDVPKEITKIYFITEDKKGRKGVIRYNGSVVLPNRYSSLIFEDNKIIAEWNGRKGLYNLNGGELLPLRYRGIVHRRDGYFVTFLGKFGLYHHKNHLEFPPQYDIMPRRCGNSEELFIVKKQKLGVVGAQNNLLVPFQFNEIQAWTNQVVLVRQGSNWYFFDLKKQKQSEFTFEDYKVIYRSENEKVIRIFKEGKYGLYSNQKGQIIPTEFSDIQIISTMQIPFYYAEKYHRKSRKYTISYFNSEGKLVYETHIPTKIYEGIDCE